VRLRAVAAFLVVGAASGVAACGGASSTSVRKSAYARGAGGFSSREVAARGCLEKHGVLPRPRYPLRAAGTVASDIRQARDSGADFTAAVRSCGVGSAHGPSFVEVLLPRGTLIRDVDRWTTCIAKSGYKLPPANTSGEGPVFPVGTDRGSRYRASATHCVSIERQELTAMRRAGQS